MIEVVDATTPTSAFDAAADTRVQEILRTYTPPKRGYVIPPVMLGELLARGLVPVENQRWWRCPCSRAGGCPHGVLYGPVTGHARVAFAPAACFEEPGAPSIAEAGADAVVIGIGSLHDLDEIPARVEATGRPGLATMLRVWYELGLRDTLTVALGRAQA